MVTTEMIIVLIILVAAIILFATEVISIDIISILIIAALVISGVLKAEEGVLGFSNSATITIAAMFVLSAGLTKTGALNVIGRKLAQLFRFNFWVGIILTMIAVGLISAFINNTPMVAILIPILLSVALKTQNSPSKLLLPLSYASMFGGVCTLIGTSTNLLVSSISENHGLGAFSMFELTPMGLVFFAAGMIYMTVIGIRITPPRGAEDSLTDQYGLRDYLTEIVLLPEAASVNKTIHDSPLRKDLDIDIIEIIRNNASIPSPHQNVVLRESDILRVRCDINKIKELKERVGIEFNTPVDQDIPESDRKEMVFVEAVIIPNSDLGGKSFNKYEFINRFDAVPLAIWHREEIAREKLDGVTLRAGDILLLELEKENLEKIKVRNANMGKSFVLLSEVEVNPAMRGKIISSILIIAAVVTAAALNIVPIMIGSILGCVLMVFNRCITMKEAYQAIDWKIIVLLAGALSLGFALDKSGGAALISSFIISLVGDYGPIAVVSALYLITSILTELMSNNASAVLLAPIAIAAAVSLGVDAKPFLMAITFAGSASFMTPVGYQTNTMIYGVGKFKFSDFLRVGTPLNIIFWIIATILIPYFYPFN